MKRRPKPQLTPRQVSLAIAAQSLRKSRAWLVHFENVEPVVRRYQEPVDMLRVMNEHAAALAAEPIGDHQK